LNGKQGTHPDRHAALIAEYAEVNSNFRLLTDIRFKLLAFLPLGPAAAVALMVVVGDGAPQRSVSAGALALCLFGLVVTVGLATYNARNDQIYVWHVERGARIERELGLFDGSFASRPNAWFEIRLPFWRWHVGHVSSVTVIYASSIALWLAGCLFAGTRLVGGATNPSGGAYVACLIAAAVLVLGGLWVVRGQRRHRRGEIEMQATRAVELAIEHQLASGKRAESHPLEFVEACVALASQDHGKRERRDEIGRRMTFYGALGPDARSLYIPHELTGVEEARQYVALIVDLPVPWIAQAPRRR
jgi:hypothetical protein